MRTQTFLLHKMVLARKLFFFFGSCNALPFKLKCSTRPVPKTRFRDSIVLGGAFWKAPGQASRGAFPIEASAAFALSSE